MKVEQFSQGDPLDGTEPPAVMIVKEFLSFLRAKALNHTHRILRHALYVKQQMTLIGHSVLWKTFRGIVITLPEITNN